ncbi:MAG: T9SS type A sorting domain-containing protein [Bacteroidia bacterium]
MTIAEKNYNPGAYIVSINIDGQIITKKVIIN